MSNVLVAAHDLERRYVVAGETIVALAQATCEISAGARIALAGRSGSGKSTLLQLLAGIDTPTGGTVVWPALPPAATVRPGYLAMVFQRESLLAPLTVLENVELPLILAGASNVGARDRARATLERFELVALAESMPEELSGGQAQRVAFARAMAQRPRVILADEPTGQLDSETAERLLATVRAELAPDAALLIATHDERVAETLSVRWFMDRGRLERAS